ncbi:MAG: hypothetical protein EON47_05155, partial [Acetobacteraceae bacterium]
MKFSLSWLKAHLETEASLAEITGLLNRIGLEVEGVEDRGAALAGFRIAHVVSAEQHPNADRLRALKVDPGDGNLLSVVCGAPNARAGMKGVVALPGAFIPGTGITLKKGEIRGVRNGPSPKWLQDLLVAIGQRPINALVDVTNLYTYG